MSTFEQGPHHARAGLKLNPETFFGGEGAKPLEMKPAFRLLI